MATYYFGANVEGQKITVRKEGESLDSPIPDLELKLKISDSVLADPEKGRAKLLTELDRLKDRILKAGTDIGPWGRTKK